MNDHLSRHKFPPNQIKVNYVDIYIYIYVCVCVCVCMQNLVTKLVVT